MTNKKQVSAETVVTLLILALFVCTPGYGSLESSLETLKTKLMTVILPILSVIGIAWASLSLFSGNPNAKQHMLYAVMGAGFGFGAQLIVDFLSTTVR